MFTFDDALIFETLVVCLFSPPAPSTGIVLFLLFCDCVLFGMMPIVKVCSDMFNTPLDPLSILCSISLLIENCSGKGCSNGCHLFLSYSF